MAKIDVYWPLRMNGTGNLSNDWVLVYNSPTYAVFDNSDGVTVECWGAAQSNGVYLTHMRYTDQAGYLIGDFSGINTFYTSDELKLGSFDHFVSKMMSGSDTVLGSDYSDVIYGYDGNDYLVGYAGNGVIRCDAGNDRAYGGYDSDTLQGGSGNDLLSGQAGNDTIRGGVGRDSCTGGGGADKFVFAALSELGKGSLKDIINDFDSSDVIDLSSIDANTKVGGNQAFNFIGGRAFTGHAGELHFANGILSGDINGDRVADFQIAVKFNGISKITSDDLHE